MDKELKYKILSDAFKKKPKDFYISHHDYNDVPFLIVRSATLHTKNFVNDDQLSEWSKEPMKYQRWVIEIIEPYLEEWGENYIGFSNILDYNYITIWVKRDGKWQIEQYDKELSLEYIKKHKRVWY